MKSTYNYRKEEYIVSLSKEELEEAFKSRSNFYNFLKSILVNTYGEDVAELCFPGEVNDEPDKF